jgi:hypothetical protein
LANNSREKTKQFCLVSYRLNGRWTFSCASLTSSLYSHMRRLLLLPAARPLPAPPPPQKYPFLSHLLRKLIRHEEPPQALTAFPDAPACVYGDLLK